MSRHLLGLSLITCAFLAAVPGGAAPTKGVHQHLTLGELFIPDGYRPHGNAVELVVQLHGSQQAAEDNLRLWGGSAVLVTVIRPGLSQVYTDLFNSETVFPRLLRETRRALRELGVAPQPRFSKVTVCSFSAGFGGLREILKYEESYRRIDALVLADTLYAGYVGDPAQHRVNPGHMGEWVRFARDAVAGQKSLVLSHCDLEPGSYASTRETADYVLAALGLPREPADEQWGEHWRLTSRAGAGRLRVYGFAGTEGPDHMRHLFNTWRLLQRLP